MCPVYITVLPAHSLSLNISPYRCLLTLYVLIFESLFLLPLKVPNLQVIS